MTRKYSKAYVEITNVCNKNCSFCPGTVRSPGRMSFEDFSHVCHSLLGLTEYIYLHVMGEPTTHPELCKFIEYATRIGLKCAVTTNGSLLSRVGDALIESGVYKVNISVHSFEEGGEDSYYAYLSSIADFADEASSGGVLTVLRLWNKGYDEGRNDRTLDFFKEKLTGEWKWGVRGARIRDKLHLEYGERFDWPDINLEVISDTAYCYGLKDQFGILVDGTVVPCCLDREGIINLGNVFTDDLSAILSSERAEKIREGFSKRCAAEELCKRCGYARRF